MVRNEYPLLFNIEISDRSLALKCFQLFFFHTRTLAESVRIQMGMRVLDSLFVLLMGRRKSYELDRLWQ